MCCAVQPFRLSLCLSGSTVPGYGGQSATARGHRYVCFYPLYVHVRLKGGVFAACELAKQKRRDNNGRMVSAGELVVGLNGWRRDARDGEEKM